MKAPPPIDYELKQEATKSFRRRVRLLRRYIDALTLKPADPLEVIHAVAHDLTEIAITYGGSFPRACGDSFTDAQNAQDAREAAKARER